MGGIGAEKALRSRHRGRSLGGAFRRSRQAGRRAEKGGARGGSPRIRLRSRDWAAAARKCPGAARKYARRMPVDADRRDWEELAGLDPFWAALTDRSRRDERWDRQEFAATGREEIDRLLAYAATLGVPARRDAALDFGCGPGRLTRALADHFGTSVGVDVSERMVREARELNADVENCRFHAGDAALGNFDDGSFDLVYSSLVLQHVSDANAVAAYVAEFVRLLAPGGLIAFQVPSRLPLLRRIQPRRRLYHGIRRLGASPRFLYRRLGLDPVGVYAVDRETVIGALEGTGSRVLRVDEEAWGGGVRSATYFATK